MYHKHLEQCLMLSRRPVGFSRQEYCCGLPFPTPGDLPHPRIEPGSPALQAYSLPSEPQGKSNNTGVGSLSLLQGIFPTQGLNPGLLHCRWTLYQLSHKGGPFYGKVKVKVVQSYSTLCDQRSLALQADSLPAEPQGKPFYGKWKYIKQDKGINSK